MISHSTKLILEQTEKLYNKAIEYAQLTGNEVVLDTYCGDWNNRAIYGFPSKHVYGVKYGTFCN